MRHRNRGGRHALPIATMFSMALASGALAQDGTTAAAASASVQWADPVTAPAEILDIERIKKSLLVDGTDSRDRAIVVGDRGHILVSESRTEWRQVPVPTRVMLTAVTAVDNAVWAVGHDQVIVYSADGGLTWTLQHHDIAIDGPLLDVMFLDGQRGFAIGAYGQFLSTVDSGANWTVQTISDRVLASAAPVVPAAVDPVDADMDAEDDDLASTDMGEDEGDPHLNAIARTSAGLLIVGEAGATYRSTDDGATWTRGDLPYEGSMFGLVALDTGAVVAFGLRGNAFASNDLGLTWRRLETGTEASLLGGAPVAGGRAVIVGASGTVLLLPSGSDQLRGYSFANGGVMSGVVPLSEIEFLTLGENGLAPYQPN
jgi:photosystem II stability/assembly factor-like uncharacterized protein